MIPTNIILPILALFAGVISLFTDIEKPKGKIMAGILVSLLSITCGFQMKAHLKAEEEGKWQKEQISNLIITLRNFESNTYKFFDEIKPKLESFGVTDDNPSFSIIQQSLEADKVRTQLSISTDSIIREKITVQYFPKNVDERIVEDSLRELSFDFKTGNPGLPDVPTNAIFFGDSVPIEAVKLVALTLIRAGVEIKYIRSFRDSTGRSSLIQVGSRKDYIDKMPISVEEIQQANSFPL